MSADTVCRVCLVSNLNLYGVRNELQNAYKRITREKYNKVGYPVSMCYICLSVLKKCDRFMETARDSNKLLKQWHNQQTEMRVAKPLATYSMTKVEFVSTENEDISSEIDIKTEKLELAEQSVVDIQTEYNECNIDADIEKKDTDEQTDNSTILVDICTDSTYNDTTEVNDDIQTDTLINNYMGNDWSRLNMISQHSDDDSQICQDIEITQVEPEIETNDGIQLSSGIEIPKDLNTETNVQEPHESDTDNIVADEVCHIENINTNKSGILKHNNTQNEKILHACDICDKSYASACSLKRHYITKHPFTTKLNTKNKFHYEIKTYSCNECSYECREKYLLIRHIKTHTGEKKFSCDICSRKFAKHSNLTRHLTIHTGKKPFLCDICSNKFVDKIDLTRHLMTHTGEKPFSCDICSRKFALKSVLTIHMRTHTGERPFSCDICGNKFTRQSHLTRHLKTHTGEKPISCSICSYKCARKSYLTVHMTTHTGDRPFSCDICSYKSAQKCNLKQHLLSKHKNNKHK